MGIADEAARLTTLAPTNAESAQTSFNEDVIVAAPGSYASRHRRFSFTEAEPKLNGKGFVI